MTTDEELRFVLGVAVVLTLAVAVWWLVKGSKLGRANGGTRS